MTARVRLRDEVLRRGQRTRVMGILNVTPDSFSGDGLLAASAPVEEAVERARRMVDEGADVLDIGAESTRPGHAPVGEATELERVVDVVVAVRRALPSVLISIDTSKAVVADACLAGGADIVNDVSAVTRGSKLAATAAVHGAPYIVMHGRGEPPGGDIVRVVIEELGSAVDAAVAAGCPRHRLIVDPGIGFGKTPEQNLRLLARLGELRELDLPILLGTSRKSTIGRVLDLPVDQRLEGTLATTALAIAAGVDIVRVHDVLANVRVARMADAIVRGSWQDAGGDAATARSQDAT